MNEATLPPWLSPWAGGLVYGQRVYKQGAGGERGPRERLRPRLTIYTLGHDHSAPILSWSESGGVSAPPMGVEGALGTMGAGGAVRWERVPLDNAPWHMDVPVPVRPEIIDRPPLFERAEVETAAGAAGWSGVLGGLVLIAMLAVSARTAVRLFYWRYPRRRHMQREWQRASVHATCHTEEGLVPPGDAEAGGGGELGPDMLLPRAADLPPPYSDEEPKVEEPPPPYVEGDSCVRFMNKNGIPVLVFNRARAAHDPAGRRQVQRILRAAGIDLASLGTPPLAPALAEASDDDSPIDFNPTSVISIITNDDDVETCLIGEAAPKDTDAEEEASEEPSAAETTNANTNGGAHGPRASEVSAARAI